MQLCQLLDFYYPQFHLISSKNDELNTKNNFTIISDAMRSPQLSAGIIPYFQKNGEYFFLCINQPLRWTNIFLQTLIWSLDLRWASSGLNPVSHYLVIKVQMSEQMNRVRDKRLRYKLLSWINNTRWKCKALHLTNIFFRFRIYFSWCSNRA